MFNMLTSTASYLTKYLANTKKPLTTQLMKNPNKLLHYDKYSYENHRRKNRLLEYS